MADLIVLSWRDIPAQVLVKAGRRTARQPLPDRFQEAIDRAAMRAGLRDTDAYLGEWRRVAAGSCGDDLEDEAERAAARLEADYTARAPARARRERRPRTPKPRIQRMTDTVVSSASKEVVIGFEQPFCIIGERINPTGRRQLAAQMAVGDYSQVQADALAQVAAGAHMLDVNAGIPLADEPRILAETIRLVQSLVDVPLSIDSSIVAALEAGLAVYQGKPLVNSVTGEEERLESVLPLIRKHGAAVVAISNDETGISEDPDVRYEVAKRIVERAADHGIPRADVVVDPLVMPVGALGSAGRAAFHLIRRLREELKVNTTCGASNVSFGLPNRHAMNATFLAMAIGAGMTAAIMNPLHAEETGAIKGADVLMGHDRNCRRWLKAYREPSAGGDARRERRRRRA